MTAADHKEIARLVERSRVEIERARKLTAEVERRIPISERRVERALENLRRAGFKV